MSTRTGFPRMDWDTGFLADPKFQHLRDLLPDPVQFGYAGFCYLRLAADAWRTCQRNPLGAIVRAATDWADVALREAGLIDEAGCIPEATFSKWVGDAVDGHKAWKDRQQKHRGSPDVTPSHVVSHDVTVTKSESPPARAIGRENREEERTDEGVQGEVGLSEDEGRVFAFIARFGAAIREDSPLGRRLVGLIERRGVEDVLRHAGPLARSNGTMSDRQWVLGLENAVEQIPSGKEGRAIDLEEERERHGRRTQQSMYEQRVERYRFTGEWDEAFGPVPA